MPRTTVNVDASVLRQLRRRSRLEGKSMGQLISELVAQALAHQGTADREPGEFRWETRAMRARVDLEDKEAVRSTLGD